MLKWIESTGKTEDAAIEAALQKLGLDRDDETPYSLLVCTSFNQIQYNRSGASYLG